MDNESVISNTPASEIGLEIEPVQNVITTTNSDKENDEDLQNVKNKQVFKEDPSLVDPNEGSAVVCTVKDQNKQPEEYPNCSEKSSEVVTDNTQVLVDINKNDNRNVSIQGGDSQLDSALLTLNEPNPQKTPVITSEDENEVISASSKTGQLILRNVPIESADTEEDCLKQNCALDINSHSEKEMQIETETCDDSTSTLDNSLELVYYRSSPQFEPSINADLNLNTTSVSDKDVVEVMDITQTEEDDDCHVVEFVHQQKGSDKCVNCEENASTNLAKLPTKAPSTSLDLLSQYGSYTDDSSESDAESVVAVPVTASKNYRTQVVEIESDLETDTGASKSSDTESENETGYLEKIAKKINKRLEENDCDDDEEDIDDHSNADSDQEKDTEKLVKKSGRRKPPRVRGEMLLDELPPIQDLQITVPAEECIEFGRVHSIVDQLLLVSALPNSILLDLDTVLFLEKGTRVLGEVFDVLGQVADPLYCVRFNTNQHIHEKGIQVGDIVYVAPKTDYTQYVILSSLTKMRGSDASWENDIEPPPRYIDYSDDEEEREARYQLRLKRRQARLENGGGDNGGDTVSVADSDDSNDDGHEGNPFTRAKCTGVRTSNERFAAMRNKRRHHPSSGDNRQTNNTHPKRQQQRFIAPGHAPRHSFQQHQTHNGSWHSHYNQQYHQSPPAHMYRSPYSAPYTYQPHFYRNPPPLQSHPGVQHFHPYMRAPHMPAGHEQYPLPAGPTNEPSPSQQMSQPPPPMHSMPPPLAPPSYAMQSAYTTGPPPHLNTPAQQISAPPKEISMQPPPSQTIPPQQMQKSHPTNYIPNPIATSPKEKIVEPAPPGED